CGGEVLSHVEDAPAAGCEGQEFTISDAVDKKELWKLPQCLREDRLYVMPVQRRMGLGRTDKGKVAIDVGNRVTEYIRDGNALQLTLIVAHKSADRVT